MPSVSLRFSAATLWLVAFASIGCDALPRDNFGTFERVRSEHVLRVGAAENSPWVNVDARLITGFEAELVEAFGRNHGATIAWSLGAQIEQAERLHEKELDLLIAGLDEQTPLQKKVVLSRPYAKTRRPDGSWVHRALAVMPGESRLLYEVDRFLLRDPEASRIRDAAERAR